MYQAVTRIRENRPFKNTQKPIILNSKNLQRYQTSDRLDWDTAMNLVSRLYRDGEFTYALLVGCGCFFGLRISDLLSLRWDMLLGKERFTLREQKTGKRREIVINETFRATIQACHDSLGVKNDSQPCFLTSLGSVPATQTVNRNLKKIKEKYRLPINHFSTHTFRKTFGYRVFTRAGDNAELALYKLSEIFNHSNTRVTRRYLGIRQDELLATYNLLDE